MSTRSVCPAASPPVRRTSAHAQSVPAGIVPSGSRSSDMPGHVAIPASTTTASSMSTSS
ncbi:MAG: hypothetical protein ACOYXW_09375 [Actinomycetota bacterium]